MAADGALRGLGQLGLFAPQFALALGDGHAFAGTQVVEVASNSATIARVRSHALEVYVHPTPGLTAIGVQARAAVRAVFGDTAAPEPPPDKPWRPHLATLYGTAEFDDTGLHAALLDGTLVENTRVVEQRTVSTMPAQALLVDQDTFAQRGFCWNTATATTILIGH